jgi:TIR domain
MCLRIASDKAALLDFLHHNGVVFHHLGLFGNRIVLDQNWALEAIYAIFDRKKILRWCAATAGLAVPIWISGFMKRIGLADHVIVVLSDKYLRSPYCMTELHSIYQRSVGEKEDFLRRIIPLVLDDARFGTWRDRLVYLSTGQRSSRRWGSTSGSRRGRLPAL